MASPGAAGRGAGKSKATMPLTAFLKPTISSQSWADDDVEVEPMPPLPTAPGGASPAPGSQPPPARPTSALPPGGPDLRPPFKIFVGNLPFEVHEQDLGDYFHALHPVRDVFILRHSDTGNARGAFVEFETAEGVQVALTHNGRMFGGRALNVDVAQSRGGFDRRGGGGRDRYGGFSDRYEERGPRGGGYADRGPPGYGDDFSDRRDRRHRDWGAPEGEADAAAHWGSRGPPPPPPHHAAGPEPAGPPAERKRLVLAPRSKQVGAGEAAGSAAEEAGGERPKKANPFGDAKPVDAAARLKELDEKIAKRKEEQRRAEREQKEAAAAAAASAAAAEEAAPVPEAAAAQAEASVSGRGPLPPPPEHGDGRHGPHASPEAGGGRGERDRVRRGGGRPGGRGGRFEEGHGGRGRGGGRFEDGPMGRGRGGGRFEEGRGRGGGRFDEGRGRGGRGPPPGHPAGRGFPPPPPAGGRGPPAEAAEGFQEAGGPRGRGGRHRGWETHTPAQATKQQQQQQPAEPAPAEGGAAAPDVSKAANMFDLLNTDE